MMKLSPVSRRKLIQTFKKLGFDGPFSGGKHMFMSRGDVDVRIPNPHKSDVSVDLLIRLLREAGVNKREWLSL